MQPATTSRSPAGFTVRRVRPEEIEQARAVIVRVLEEDIGGGYQPGLHFDLDDMRAVYIDNLRHALFVAVDDVSGAVIGTTGICNRAPNSPPHPRWLAERYTGAHVAQIFRVYIAREERRRGVARVLVEAARRFAKDEGGYTVIYLHTNAGVPGAEAFWRSMPTTEVHDGRHELPTKPVHFELAFPD